MASDLVNATITSPNSFENGDFHKNHRITNWPQTSCHWSPLSGLSHTDSFETSPHPAHTLTASLWGKYRGQCQKLYWSLGIQYSLFLPFLPGQSHNHSCLSSWSSMTLLGNPCWQLLMIFLFLEMFSRISCFIIFSRIKTRLITL